MSEIRRHRLPNAQEWPKAIFSNLKKYLDKIESLKRLLRKIKPYCDFFIIKIIINDLKQLLKVSYFSSGVKSLKS